IKYPEIYERNSQFVFDIAQEYTFTNIAKKLYRKLGYSDIFIESINLRKKLSFFEEYKLPSNKSFNLTNSINISDELSKTREYAKEANEKYKKAMKQLTETKKFAEISNIKYKETMEKHKKSVSDYNHMKNEKEKLEKELKEIKKHLPKTLE